MNEKLSELRSFDHLKNGPIHTWLVAECNKLALTQRGLRDDVEFRWNQGRQQMLCDIIAKIEGARDEHERVEQSERKRLAPRANAF